MIVACFLITTLVLAVVALGIIFNGALQRHWSQLLAGLCLAVFTYLYGQWIFLSAYARYVFALCAAFTLITALFRNSESRRRKSRHASYLALAALLLLIDVLYYTGTSGATHFADLGFPLKGGRYFVFQGGKGLPSNVFHFNARRAVYAMDIVKLDQWGRRSSRIFSKSLTDYYIFGDTIYSPCSGIVQRAVDINPDNIPPAMERGPQNLNGVLIEGSNYYVYMGHMQQGRVFVHAGDSVASGQALGLVGNSGKSLEPHLHIQVHQKTTDDRPWYAQPQLFMRFNGKEYLLFDVIE
jgi:hypothetical protein